MKLSTSRGFDQRMRPTPMQVGNRAICDCRGVAGISVCFIRRGGKMKIDDQEDLDNFGIPP